MTKEFKDRILNTITVAEQYKTKEFILLDIFPKRQDAHYYFLFSKQQDGYRLEAIGERDKSGDAPTELIGSLFSFDDVIDLTEGCWRLNIEQSSEYFDDEDILAVVDIDKQEISVF